MGIEQQGTPNSKEQIDTYVESTPDSGINAVNDWIDVAANSENTIINVLYNDESNDGPLNISGFVQPANGIVTDNGNGTFSYTPNPGYAGKDTFTYTVTDDAGNESSAMVEIYVIGSGSMPDDGNGNDEQPVNSEPDAKWDDAVTDENQPVVINVLENDKDPDGDPITITGFTQPQNGVVVRNDDGSFTYTPNPGFHGTDVFEYSVTDGVNDWGDTAKVTIEVRDINQAPNAQDDAGVTDKNTPVVIDVLANDSDPDGDALTVMSATANNGTVEINADGKLVYTPNDGFSGLDNITYTITDPSGEQASATVAVTVRNANEIPVAHGDSAEIVEDQSVIIDALANDSDPDGDALTITSFDQPVNGMVIQDASGNFVYRPNAGFSGTDSFTYTVSDGNGGTDTATVTITVKPAVPPEPLNTAPDADTDVAFIDQDQTSIIDVLANDSDADGDVLSVSQYSQPGHGSLVLNDDGTFSYQPDADFAGVDYFEYTIDDGNGGTDTARVYVCVHDTNQGPDADDDMALLTDNAPAVIDVLANDSDPDGDAIFISGFSDPMNGTVTLNADGTFNYTPKDGFSGLDSFTYTIMDNNGGSDTATVKIFVPQVNAAPVAADDNVSTQEDQPVVIDALNNDSDPDGDMLAVMSFDQPANGTVVQNADGTFSYTPNADFNGTDTFSYTVTDGNGGTSTATVQVVVAPANDGPVAMDDSANVDEDGSVKIDVLSNDSDLDGDSLSVTEVGQPANGSVTINADGTISYTPAEDYNGSDSFTYTISDGNGGTATATVYVCVKPVNDAPTAQDDAASTNEDAPVVIDVLSNDSDPDGDALSIDSFEQPANGTVVQNADGTFSYTPNADFNGTDTFTYTVTDGSGGTSTATVQVVVAPANDDPIPGDDEVVTNEDQAVTVDVLANDSDPDGDSLSITEIGQPAHGTVVQNADGTLTYTPEADFNGNDVFTYTIDDGNGGNDTATVYVCVKPVNDAPVATDDSATTNEDAPVVIDVLSNDSDVDGDALSIDSFEQPANGTVVQNADGTFSYTPNADFNGTDTFTYTVTDGNGGTSTATVQVVVAPANDGPVAMDDSANVDEDGSVKIDVLSNDSDLDGDSLSVTEVGQPANGTVTINDDGTVSYTPTEDYNGSDSFTYTISDGNGGTATATVYVCVKPVNDAPTAQDDAASTNEDAPVIIDVLSNDSDPDGDALSIDSFEQPANGTVVQNADGTFSYTPNADFNGTDTFTYTVTDGNGGTSTATVQVVVAPANDGPVAMDDSANVDEDGSVKIDVLSNDSDLDGDSLSVTEVGQPANGSVTINADGTISYTPTEDYNGSDSFTYTISDGNGGAATATVYVCVKPVNDAPVATDDNAETSEDAPVVIDVLSNDSDPDGDALSIDSFEQPANGTVVQNADGTFSYTPNADFNGTDTFSYTVTDGNGGTSTATVQVVVAPANDGPVAMDDKASVDEDGSVKIDVLSNDSDLDGDSLSVTEVGQPANGSVSINADGSVSYTPAEDYNGSDSFTYTISDGNGGTATATVYVCVKPVNDAPVATDDNAETSEDAPVVIDVLSIDSFEQPANGTVVQNAGGTFSYTPNADFNGTDTFTYTVTDGNGGTSTATVQVVVASVNEAPDANKDKATTEEGESVVIDALANDTDPDGDALTIESFKQPKHGTVELNDDGTFTYTPDDGFSGRDKFYYTVSDGHGGTDQAKVYIKVEPGQPDNRAPDANKDRFEAESGEPVVLDVLANDTDPDGDTLTIESFKQPKHGTVELNDDGTFTYTADDGYCGKDYFTYTVSDGNGGTDRAKVYIKVEPGQPDNQAPAADDDSATTLANQAVVIDVLANDWDADGDVLSIDGFEQPEHGLVVQNPDGTLTYQPEAGFSGTDRFTYRVSDGEGGFDTAVVMVTVDDSGSGSPVCAKLVGDTEVNEGETASYRVVLDQPVDHDAWFQIRVSDGSANRVDEWAGDQDIMAGGYYDIRWGIGGEVIDVIYGKVPNGQYVSDGNRDMVGPVDQSADYSLVQDGCIIQGDTVWVKVPAGESSSTALDVATWREMVTVDRDANNAGDYYEGTEDLSVAIVGSENAGDIEVCDAQLDVNIYDTTSYAYVSPIAIDMNGDGVQTTALGATEGKFDLLNNGEAVESGWLSGDDAFLAVDANGNGEIDDRSELFGGQVGEGFAKLASYDSNNDGVVDANDERFDELKVWQDVNQNHQTDEGELMTLDEAGIASLSTGYSVLGEVDSAGNMHLEQGTVTMADGSQAAMSDVYFNMAPDANGELPSIDDLLADAGDSLAELLGEADQPASQPAPSSGEVAALDTQGASDALKQLADVYEQQPQDVDPLG